MILFENVFQGRENASIGAEGSPLLLPPFHRGGRMDGFMFILTYSVMNQCNSV